MIRKGTIVKLKGRGREKAKVLGTSLTFWNKIIKGALFLETPLEGIRYWNVDDVERAN